ncbi:MAG: 3-deoxy-7-phosphoheptulonate synthase, partial [Ilumatobacteraceae bacterium]
MPQQWSPSSWKDHPIKQQPAWPDEAAYDRALKDIASMPPLVFAGEARSLQANLAKVAAGNAFLLQAGDCAESFEEFSADNIREKLRVILQMAVVLTYSMGVPVVKVGRIAGQFAKPRSSDTEMVGDLELPSFRGHIVNDQTTTEAARQPHPDRLVQAYHQSASTLHLVRAFTKAGFAAP